METPDVELTGVAHFLYEVGYLKRVPRTGWLIAGVAQPESVAEHSFRAALIALLLAELEGADAAKAVMLALLHDTQETRIGDVPSVGKAYVKTTDNVTVTSDQTASFPPALAQRLVALVSEYEGRESPESIIARDADKLECLLQAREYQAAGYVDVPPWIETSLAALRSASGRRLGELCLRVAPKDWWAAAAAAYPQTQRPHAV